MTRLAGGRDGVGAALPPVVVALALAVSRSRTIARMTIAIPASNAAPTWPFWRAWRTFLPRPGRADEGGDDDHREGQHDRLVDPDPDRPPGQRQLDLARGPGSGSSPSEMAASIVRRDASDPERGDPDGRRDRVDERGDRGRRRTDEEQQGHRREIGERRHDLHDVEDRRDQAAEALGCGRPGSRAGSRSPATITTAASIRARVAMLGSHRPRMPSAAKPADTRIARREAAEDEPERASDRDDARPAEEREQRHEGADEGADAGRRIGSMIRGTGFAARLASTQSRDAVEDLEDRGIGIVRQRRTDRGRCDVQAVIRRRGRWRGCVDDRGLDPARPRAS